MIRIELRKGESLQGINVPLLGGTVSNSSARPMGDLGEESGQGESLPKVVLLDFQLKSTSGTPIHRAGG